MKKELFVPGRTELAGNHTDHQRGKVMAGSVELDAITREDSVDMDADSTKMTTSAMRIGVRLESMVGMMESKPSASMLT